MAEVVAAGSWPSVLLGEVEVHDSIWPVWFGPSYCLTIFAWLLHIKQKACCPCLTFCHFLKSSMASGLDPHRSETGKYGCQICSSFSIILWMIVWVLFCKMMFCCSEIRSFTSPYIKRMGTNTLFPKGLNDTSVSVSNGFASLRYASTFIRT